MAGEIQETSSSSVLNMVLDFVNEILEISAYRRVHDISGQWLENLRGIRIYSRCYERCSLIRLAVHSYYLYTTDTVM
jgi:hypothetical protein